MNRIKIGFIGYNRLSHAAPVLSSIKSNSDVFEIVGYALAENEREKFPDMMEAFDGYKEMTVDEILNNPDIEAVVIETEEIYLTKYALLAAKCGKHIHMEKPGGTSLKEFTEMIDAVKAGGKVFHTGYMYRYNPTVIEIMKNVKDGKYGEIFSVEAQMNCWHKPENRQWLEGFPGGMMFFLGCHLVDIILQIQGEPEEVIPLSCCTGIDGVTATDFGMAVFRYKNGVSFAKTAAVEASGFTRRQIVITGSKGTVEIKPLEITFPRGIQQTKVREKMDVASWNDFGIQTTSDNYNRYNDMMRSFAAMVRGEKTNPITPDYELLLYKYVLKACGVQE